MTITAPADLRHALAHRGLLDAATAVEAPDPAPAPDRPWYIGLLLGVSGWLAGLFLLGFVGLLFRPDTPVAAGIAGAVLLAAAWGLYRADREGAFVAQLALALSIAGQCLVLFALNDDARGIGPIAASALLLQAVLALAMPNPLHRALSAFFATIAWALTVRFALFGEPEFWHGERERAVSLGASLTGWALAWLPVAGGIALLIRHEAGWVARGRAAALRPVLAGLIVGLAFATLASQPFESFRWWGGGAVAQGWLALWPLLSAGAALAAVAAAFALGQRALLGAGVLAALLHVSHFYYALGTGLLFKSLLMLAMGGAMWFAARALARRSTEGEAA